MRHVHAEVVLQLAQIVLVGLEHGGLLVEQLAPFLLEVGVGGLLQCQRSAVAELELRAHEARLFRRAEARVGGRIEDRSVSYFGDACPEEERQERHVESGFQRVE